MDDLLRFNFKQKYIIFDTETEGLNLINSKPWQIFRNQPRPHGPEGAAPSDRRAGVAPAGRGDQTQSAPAACVPGTAPSEWKRPPF